MQWDPKQYGNCWFRVYLSLALTCNVNVLDAVYWATPWNRELIEKTFSSKHRNNMHLHFDPIKIGKQSGMCVLIYEPALERTQTIWIFAYEWLHRY